MKNEDELKSCESYGNDYTIKVYQKKNRKCYSVVVYETDDDSEVTFISAVQQDAEKARALAIDNAKRHAKEARK